MHRSGCHAHDRWGPRAKPERRNTDAIAAAMAPASKSSGCRDAKRNRTLLATAGLAQIAAAILARAQSGVQVRS
jgi:hypothetical protein